MSKEASDQLNVDQIKGQNLRQLIKLNSFFCRLLNQVHLKGSKDRIQFNRVKR